MAGCGCGKKAGAATTGHARSGSSKIMYQVIMPDGSVNDEFVTLTEARQKAGLAGGRVRTSSKVN